MSQLIVRKVGADIVRALKRRAARNGRSAEAEHREILREALRGDAERESFKHALTAMPDVGDDTDFLIGRGLPWHGDIDQIDPFVREAGTRVIERSEW